MPKFRTRKSERTTYIYFDAYGRIAAELRPGEEGVTEAIIADLHAADDDVNNADRRGRRFRQFHYDQTNVNGENLPSDRQTSLANNDANPETIFIKTLEAAERSGAFKSEWDALSDEQRDLVLQKLLKRTNTDIAKEKGCTEAAIRNRLAK